MTTDDWVRPEYRFRLKALIVSSGFKTLREFAENINCPAPVISRVVSGYEIPSPSLARRMSASLGIDLRTLRDLM
jgi:ribosome-binding protein aMBF1 (putative translation factor)